MNLPGIEVSPQAQAHADELWQRMARSESMLPPEADTEVDEVRAYVLDAGPHDVATLVAFANNATQAYEAGEPVVYGPKEYGGMIAMIGTSILRHDEELGCRMVHQLLTSGDRQIAATAWSYIQETYEKGKMPYKTFLPFFLTRKLVEKF